MPSGDFTHGGSFERPAYRSSPPLSQRLANPQIHFELVGFKPKGLHVNAAWTEQYGALSTPDLQTP